MRPVRLEASGFSAFRERVELDFERVDFFALVGPTGSGKSSIIDAICFALYGSVPRYDDKRRVGFVVTTGASEARVSLTFDVDRQRFVATRIVRRKPDGGATTKEARLEKHVGPNETKVLAGSADELENEVARLLGLPFDHFTKCVVLPQGAFARFLHDKPADRQELLVTLLGLKIYERVGQRARQRHTDVSARVAAKERRIQELAHATEEAKEEAIARDKIRRELRADFAAARPRIEVLEKESQMLLEGAAAARKLLSLARKVAVPTVVTELAGRRAQKQTAVLEAEKAAKKVDLEVARAEKEVQSKPKLASLQVLLSTHEDLEACHAALNIAKEALRTAEHGEAGAAAKLSAAQATADQAKALGDESRQAHAAHSLARRLTVGAPCPVCRQTVASVPKGKAPAALRNAEDAEEKAGEALRQARRQKDEKSEARASAKTALEKIESRIKGLSKQVAEHPVKKNLQTLLKERQDLETNLDSARRRGLDQRQQSDKLRSEVELIDSQLRDFGRTFDGQRDALVSLEPPAPKRVDLAADWQALATWSEKQVPILKVRTEDAETGAAKVNVQRNEKIEELRKRCEEAGIPAQQGAPLLSLLEEVVSAESDARNELKKITYELKEGAGLANEVRVLRQEGEVARELGRLLSAKGFEQWLVSEALQQLVLGGSSTLQKLSGGQYSLCCDDKGEFLVVDHRNADETRSAKTLSGGETFQASLALALALSDQLSALAANGSASLDAIFLDEGFGTLDTDALGIVGDTIEAIGGGERMVGIVTHVKELAERVPVRYVVQKGSRTSTVERIIA